MAVQTIGERTESVRRLIGTIAGIVLAAAVVLALDLARMWSRPLKQITLIARRLSRGDLSARAPTSGSDELAVLGQ